MKKVIYTLSAGILLFTACGPSAEEQAQEQKRVADSAVAAESARIQDSLMQASLAEDARRDSLRAVAVADSLANAANKPAAKPRKTQQQINKEKLDKEVKDATRGRG